MQESRGFEILSGDLSRSSCGVVWKRLATPRFRGRAKIGGGELLNIGWK